jgi:hypothetical protein
VACGHPGAGRDEEDDVMSEDTSAWAVGWAAFAAIMLMMAGFFHGLTGLVALFEDTYFVVGREWVFEFDVTAWGWIHLIWGLALIAAGFGIFSGNVAARTVGVVAAALSAIINFAWLPYQPVWGTIMIAVSIAVIWSLTVHGRDIATR